MGNKKRPPMWAKKQKFAKDIRDNAITAGQVSESATEPLVPTMKTTPRVTTESLSESHRSVDPERLAKDLMERWASKLVHRLVPVADAFWRAKQKIGQVSPEELPGQLRNLGRNIDAGIDGLKEAGFEIQDHTGNPYVDGLPTEVMAFQEMDGLGSKVIVETLKPSIYFDNQLVRRGQIIVGMPKDTTN